MYRSQTRTTHSSHSISKTAIIGASVGAAVGLLLLAVLLFLCWRLSRRRKASIQSPLTPALPMQGPSTPALPMQRPSMMEAGYGDARYPDSFMPPFIASVPHHTKTPSIASSSSSSSIKSTTKMLGRDVPKLNMPKPPPHGVIRSTSSGQTMVSIFPLIRDAEHCSIDTHVLI